MVSYSINYPKNIEKESPLISICFNIFIPVLILKNGDNWIHKILDLFAGCGSLGIEALSMGANFVTFIDSSPISIKYIKENLKKCTFEDSSDVQKKDFSVATRELMRKDVKFDLIFIDADKNNYTNYYKECIKLLRPNGIMVLDNMLWGGKILNPKDKETKTIAKTAKVINDDQNCFNTMLPIRDGLMLCIKK